MVCFFILEIDNNQNTILEHPWIIAFEGLRVDNWCVLCRLIGSWFVDMFLFTMISSIANACIHSDYLRDNVILGDIWCSSSREGSLSSSFYGNILGTLYYKYDNRVKRRTFKFIVDVNNGCRKPFLIDDEFSTVDRKILPVHIFSISPSLNPPLWRPVGIRLRVGPQYT